MMRIVNGCLLACACLLMPGLTSWDVVSAAEPERIDLWSGRAQTGNGEFENVPVWLTVYRAEGSKRPALVICPGGGYGGHAIEPEGHGIAKWLNGHGVTGLVLQYRLPAGRSEVPLLDVQRAIRTARANAETWGLDPKRLGIIGFSAGGHLAASASTLFDNGRADSEDAIEKLSSRPDFSILIYPVISMGELGHGGSRKNLLGESPSEELIRRFSCDQQVTADTPPAFLAHAVDDKVVVLANSRVYHDAQLRHGVASMLLELPSGGHGLNRYQGPMWDAWQGAALKFLEGQFGKPLND